MNDMNPRAIAGDNSPPSAIDEILAKFGDTITEAESWQDGEKIENEGQMKAVDALAKSMKSVLKAVKAGETAETAPLTAQHKAAKARWKPTIDDLGLQIKNLVFLGGDFKVKLKAKQDEEKRLEWEKLDKLRREAEAKDAEAASGDIEAQREVAAAKQQVMEQQKVASATQKITVPKMRKVTKHEYFAPTEDNPRGGRRLALNDIAQNDPEAMTAFIDDYVQKNHKTRTIAGVRVWTEREAF